ncbi:MAG TPA: heme-binding domain-containing protein [Verrucomicrobiae bacterium]
MRKKFPWIVGALLVLFALLQLANPSRVNPPVQNSFPITHAPPDVQAMFRAACYDCHSDETRWPWYSHIAPVSLLVAGDVKRGRSHLNLSEWPADSARAAKKMEIMGDEIDDGDMPLKKYTLIHTDARLTDSQRKAMEDWLTSEATNLKAQK